MLSVYGIYQNVKNVFINIFIEIKISIHELIELTYNIYCYYNLWIDVNSLIDTWH